MRCGRNGRMEARVRRKGLMALIPIVIIAATAAACGSGSTTTTTTSATSTTPAAPTFGQMSGAGNTVFAAKCSACHGANGQGVTAPAVIGSGAQLAKYQTAQGLLAFIDTNMPFNAPGTLSHADYLNVLAYLLVQNQDVTAGTAFVNESQLGSIALK